VAGRSGDGDGFGNDGGGFDGSRRWSGGERTRRCHLEEGVNRRFKNFYDMCLINSE
jgi:hypothetical protein